MGTSYVVNNSGQTLLYNGKTIYLPSDYKRVLNDGNTIGWFISSSEYLAKPSSDVSISMWINLSSSNNIYNNSIPERPQWDNTNLEVDFNPAAGTTHNLTSSDLGTINQPYTLYMVMRQNSRSTNYNIYQFSPTVPVRQGDANNKITVNAGNTLTLVNAEVSTYGVLTCVVSGANSIIQWNEKDASTGNAGTSSASYMRICAGINSAQISVKEMIFRKCADSQENRTLIYNYLYNKYPEVSLYSTYNTVYNAFNTKPSASVIRAQNTLVKSLVDASFWDRMDLFYVFANDAVDNAKINWKNPSTYNCVESGSGALTFTAYEGFTGDGTNFLNTNFNASTNAVNMSINSITLGIYTRVAYAEDSVDRDMGASDDTNYLNVRLTVADSSVGAYRLNSLTGDSAAVNSVNSKGFFVATRRATDDMEIYKNGGSIGTGDATSSAKPDASIFILGCSGSTIRTSKNQISIALLMNGVTDAEDASISSIINTYMTTIDKNIY